jgi:hypothetical protein
MTQLLINGFVTGLGFGLALAACAAAPRAARAAWNFIWRQD